MSEAPVTSDEPIEVVLAEVVRRRHAMVGPKLGCDDDNDSLDPATAEGDTLVYCRTCGLVLARFPEGAEEVGDE